MKVNNGFVNLGIMALIVACLAVTSFVGFQMYGQSAKSASAIGTDDQTGQSYQSTCELGTDVTVRGSYVDAKQTGTTGLGGTLYASVDGAAYSTTTTPASVGSVIDYYFLNGSTYHSTVLNDVKTPCAGEMPIEMKLLGNSSLTITVYNQYGTATLSDGGGATNLSLASGESATVKVMLQAQNLKGTQKMRCVLESNSTTKMKEMKLDGFGATPAVRPSFYTVNATKSVTWAYDINSVEGATPVEGYIYMEPKTSQDLSGSMFIIDCYTYEYFLDSVTGQVPFDIEDSQGTKKSIGTYRAVYWID